jgi:hypothetical protein
VSLTDPRLVAGWEDIDRPERGFFCGVELLVTAQQTSKFQQRESLYRSVIDPLADFE